MMSMTGTKRSQRQKASHPSYSQVGLTHYIYVLKINNNLIYPQTRGLDKQCLFRLAHSKSPGNWEDHLCQFIDYTKEKETSIFMTGAIFTTLGQASTKVRLPSFLRTQEKLRDKASSISFRCLPLREMVVKSLRLF